jgi:hypothetical protein
MDADRQALVAALRKKAEQEISFSPYLEEHRKANPYGQFSAPVPATNQPQFLPPRKPRDKDNTI